MRMDEALEDIGDFGVYQRQLYMLLVVTSSFPVMQKWIWTFIAAAPPHRCKLPFEDADNASVMKAAAGPGWMTDVRDNQWEPCHTYFPLFPNSTHWQLIGWGQTGILASSEEPNATVECSAWVYDTSRYKTVMSEYNVVCERQSLQQLGWMLHIAGEVLGYMMFGAMADRYGRKKVFFVCLSCQVLTGMMSGMVGSLYVIIAMRAALGMFGAGCLVGAVLRIEYIGPSVRMIAAVVDRIAASLAVILLAIFAYFLPDWRHLQIIVSIPPFLFLSCWWYVPESARWYLAQKREGKGKKIIGEMANENRRELTAYDTYDVDEDDQTKGNLSQMNPLNLCCFSYTRKRFFFSSFIWFSNGVAFYYLATWMPLLSDNVHIRLVLSALMELPAYVMCLFTLNRFGKRYPLCLTMVTGGALIGTLFFIPEEYPSWVVIIIIGVARVNLVAGFTAVYAFSMELHATAVRGSALGLQATFIAVGELITPWLFVLSHHNWEPLPIVISAGLSVLSGLGALLLPETTGRQMPETLQDVEKNYKDDDELNSSVSNTTRQGSISIAVPPRPARAEDDVTNFLTVPKADHT